MLRSLKDLYGYRVQANDGEAGVVDEFYFDDATWIIRYVIVDLGGWLRNQHVLLSPMSIGQPDWETKMMGTNLTKEQMEASPSAGAVLPVSKQGDKLLRAQYATATRASEEQDCLEPLPAPDIESGAGLRGDDGLDPHLRSAREVLDYRIRASDCDVGSVEDLIIDDESWSIRYMVVNTGVASLGWLPGKKVLVAPAWIDDVVWEEKKVHVSLGSETIQSSPGFDPAAPVNREYEVRLYDYYGRPKYWR